MNLFTFSVVKRIGEGNYLNDESFILERVRKERALNIERPKMIRKRFKNRIFGKDGRPNSS